MNTYTVYTMYTVQTHVHAQFLVFRTIYILFLLFFEILKNKLFKFNLNTLYQTLPGPLPCMTPRQDLRIPTLPRPTSPLPIIYLSDCHMLLISYLFFST